MLVLGEVIKQGDLKCIPGEGMPHYKNPFEKGNLVIQFVVHFPENNFVAADKVFFLFFLQILIAFFTNPAFRFRSWRIFCHRVVNARFRRTQKKPFWSKWTLLTSLDLIGAGIICSSIHTAMMRMTTRIIWTKICRELAASDAISNERFER